MTIVTQNHFVASKSWWLGVSKIKFSQNYHDYFQIHTAGPSLIDIMMQISKTAKSVTWSNHVKQKLNIKLPENVNEMPDIVRLTPNGAIFLVNNNNVEHKFTVIIYCSGYQHSFRLTAK